MARHRHRAAAFHEGDIVYFAPHVSAKVYGPGGFNRDSRLVVVDHSLAVRPPHTHRYNVRATEPVRGYLRDGWFDEADLVRG